MKLLFDHNVSPSLIDRLQDLFPDSEHVFNIALHRAGDVNVWTYARDNGFVLVSKDVDFLEMSLLRGFPPKLLWGRVAQMQARHRFVILSGSEGSQDAQLLDFTEPSSSRSFASSRESGLWRFGRAPPRGFL